MADLFLSQACLHYRNKAVFTDLALTIPAGRWTCILGSSGVGKSSLLRLIAGLPAEDSTAFNAVLAASDSKPLTNRIAYMAQKDLLMPWLNILENVLLGYTLRAERSAVQRERATQLLAAVGLAEHIKSRPMQLSGGQRQRAALVRTLLEDKPIVLMDEPFSALDAVTRYRLQALAAELLKDRTVVLVTHDPLEALRLGHQIHILAGSPAQVVKTIEPKSKPLREINAPEMIPLEDQIWQALLN